MKKRILEYILLLVFPILFLIILIPQIINLLKENDEYEFITAARLVLESAESKYLENNLNGVSSVITCKDIVSLNNNYSHCSIYIENDKISVTLNGTNKYSNMNICSKSKNNISIDNNCDNICVNINIYDVNKPYVIKNYDKCISYTKNLLIDDLGYTNDNVLEFCTGKKTDNYMKKLLQYGITEEELVDNNVINGTINNVCIPTEFKSLCFTFKIYTEKNRNYAEVINYDDNCGNDVSIPSLIMGVSVEGIGEYAFSGKKVNNVEFPDTIRYINTGAFQGHGDGENSLLRGVYLSNELDLSHLNKLEYIDYFAFADNNITKLKLPNSIKYIGNYSFSGNKIKGELDLSNTKLNKIDAYSFSGSDITSVKLPLSLKTIGYTAFAGNKIKGELDLSLNKNLKLIEEDAFADNDITSIKLPISLVNIKQMAFFNNKIKGELDLSLNENLKYIGSNSFKNNDIESIILPENVESIEKNAFVKDDMSNKNLINVTNLSNKTFDWSNIIYGTEDELFVFGTINDVEIKELEITSE